MTTRWRFPKLSNERTVVGSDVLEVDGDGFVVGEVSPAAHALLAATRFTGFRYWELVTTPDADPPPPNTPALEAETLAPSLFSEPAPVAPASDTKTRKRGKT